MYTLTTGKQPMPLVGAWLLTLLYTGGAGGLTYLITKAAKAPADTKAAFTILASIAAFITGYVSHIKRDEPTIGPRARPIISSSVSQTVQDLDEIKNRLSQLENRQVPNYQQAITNIQKNIQNLSQRLKIEQQQQPTNYQDDLNSINQRLDTIVNRLNTNQITINNIPVEIGQLRDDLETLTNRIISEAGQFAVLPPEYYQKIGRLESRITQAAQQFNQKIQGLRQAPPEQSISQEQGTSLGAILFFIVIVAAFGAIGFGIVKSFKPKTKDKGIVSVPKSQVKTRKKRKKTKPE